MTSPLPSGYNPPGVYVTADNSSVSGAVGIQPTVVCLIGPGLGYQSTSENLIFTDVSESKTLRQPGIQQGSIVVSYTDVNGTVIPLVKDSDYSVLASDGSAPTSTTTITPVNGGALPINTTVVVSYNYANANYFALNSFSDFATLISVYGNPFDAQGNIQSPLSLAAQIAFENGASNIYTVALNGLGSLSDQYKAAYALTETNIAIDITVPVFKAGSIPDFSSLQPFIAGLVAHLQNTENEAAPRVGLMGVPHDFDDSVTPDTIASAFHYRRAVFVWPKELLYYNTGTNATTLVGGTYLAAAAAGVLANNPVNQGLTRRQIRSFSGLSLNAIQQSSLTNKNIWSAAGVAVAELNRLNQLVIRHGTTTDPSTVFNRELSIVRCQDALFDIVQQSLDQADLIGTPITNNTVLSVKSILTGALETCVSTNTIQAYNNLTVLQQSLPNGDPTVVEAMFSYQPTYPLNYITVTFTLDLSTGTVTSTDTSTNSSSS